MASPFSQKDGISHPLQRHFFPQAPPASLSDLPSLSGDHLLPPHLRNLVLNQEASNSFTPGGGIAMSQRPGVLFGETLQFMEHPGQPIEQDRA